MSRGETILECIIFPPPMPESAVSRGFRLLGQVRLSKIITSKEVAMARFKVDALKTILAVLMLTGCSTKVTRVTSDSTIDLTGKWNDTDSRLVAEEMVKDALNGPWYNKYTGGGKTTPTVIVGEIRNKSHEHISTETFINDMQRSL